MKGRWLRYGRHVALPILLSAAMSGAVVALVTAWEAHHTINALLSFTLTKVLPVWFACGQLPDWVKYPRYMVLLSAVLYIALAWASWGLLSTYLMQTV